MARNRYDTTKLGFFDRTIENCQVVTIPAGATPKYIIVELPYEDEPRVSAWWTGQPAGLAVNDFVDVRWSPKGRIQYKITGTSAGTPASAGGGGWPFIHILTVSTADADADHATIADAITAASTSDGILLEAESFNEVVTLNKFVYLKGYDYSVSIVNRKITSSAAASLEKLQVFTSADTEALEVNTTNGTRIRDCRFTTSAVANSKALYIRKNADLFDARILGTGTGSTYGLYVDTASTVVNVYRGEIQGPTADVYADTGAAVNLYGPVLANGTIAGAGTVKGNYFYNGVQYYIDTSVSATPIVISGPAAEGATGVTELATQAETDAGTDDLRTVTPLKLLRYGKRDNRVCDGRLTLASGTPVTTTDQTAKTTLYFTPYTGNRISLYDGTRWVPYVFSELSYDLTGLAANKNYDAFVYDSAGTIYLDIVAWTNDSTRATALTTQDGVYVKTGDATWRYVGTWRATGTTGQCEDSVTSRFVWNMYNRVRRYLFRFENTTHNYAGNAYRAWNGDTTQFLAFVVGLDDVVQYELNTQCRADATAAGTVVIVRASRDGFAANYQVEYVGNYNQQYVAAMCGAEILFAEGYHTINANEFAGTNGGDFVQMILTGNLFG